MTQLPFSAPLDPPEVVERVSLRPCGKLCREGPDGIDVYAEELARLDKLGLQWTEVSVLWGEGDTSQRVADGIGVIIHVDRDLKPVTIFGWTDEESS